MKTSKKDFREEKINRAIIEKRMIKHNNRLAKMELCKKMAWVDNFYAYWFDQLSKPENKEKTKIEVFNDVNNMFSEFSKSGSKRFVNYNAFRNELNKDDE